MEFIEPQIKLITMYNIAAHTLQTWQAARQKRTIEDQELIIKR